MVLALEDLHDNKKHMIETFMNFIIEFLLVDPMTRNSIISTTSSNLSNWSRLQFMATFSIYWFVLLIGSRFDFDHYGLVDHLDKVN